MWISSELPVIVLFLFSVPCLAFHPTSLTIKWISNEADCSGYFFDHNMIARSLENACPRESNRGRWINKFRELQLYDGNDIEGPDPRAMWRIKVPNAQGGTLYLLVIHWDKKLSQCHYLGALMHKSNKYIPCINRYSEYVVIKSGNTA
ncbi:hypothetical protein GcC1_087029 [Golovinomyces cichoracearum]|uniref:Secreted effector protein n=1 Tax=Golovinomyces cichoracearum TaxID=62708 RepID=A0A420IH67_9PEZI|nr:hypothetical protein GcC1_087029 [Golovinomyces cichoracearum]